MQPVDSTSLNELKRVLPEAKGLLCASSVFNLEWTNKKFAKPIIVSTLKTFVNFDCCIYIRDSSIQHSKQHSNELRGQTRLKSRSDRVDSNRVMDIGSLRIVSSVNSDALQLKTVMQHTWLFVIKFNLPPKLFWSAISTILLFS